MHAYDNLGESMGFILRGEERVENKSLGGRADVYTQDTDAACTLARHADTIADVCRSTRTLQSIRRPTPRQAADHECLVFYLGLRKRFYFAEVA
jgi:hypothetical protein